MERPGPEKSPAFVWNGQSLEALFHGGTLPSRSLDGFYRGRFLSFNLVPAISELARWLVAMWRPWKGKFFDGSRQQGENLVSAGFRTVSRPLWPLYVGYRPAGAGHYRAFPFRTEIRRESVESEREVLALRYDLPGNPRLVRQIRDEVRQIDAELYLGRAYFGWGRRQRRFAYFLLWPGGSPPAS